MQTPNIIDSLGFYKLLGFHELEIGDVLTHKYAVVSDGELCIGLHDRSLDVPALTFVHQELAHQAFPSRPKGCSHRQLFYDSRSDG